MPRRNKRNAICRSSRVVRRSGASCFRSPAADLTWRGCEQSVQRVRLVVYDVRGARVRTLVNREQTGGSYTVEWDGRNDQGQRVAHLEAR